MVSPDEPESEKRRHADQPKHIEECSGAVRWRWAKCLARQEVECQARRGRHRRQHNLADRLGEERKGPNLACTAGRPSYLSSWWGTQLSASEPVICDSFFSCQPGIRSVPL